MAISRYSSYDNDFSFSKYEVTLSGFPFLMKKRGKNVRKIAEGLYVICSGNYRAIEFLKIKSLRTFISL